MSVVVKRISTSACEMIAATKTAVPRTERRKKAATNKSENRAVENRAENVHRLDQVLDQIGEEGEGDGHNPPARGKQLRHSQVMLVGTIWPNEWSIEIHLGGGAERVQLRGGR